MKILTNILIAGWMLFSAANGAAAQTNHRISDVRAFLIYEENGAASRNILNGDFVLWNAVIGEGDAENHSSATLVHIILTTDGKPPKVATALSFSAVSAGGEGGNYAKKLDYVFPASGNGKLFIPFILHDTGCREITLTAKLIDRAKPATVYQTVRKIIPFNCGE